MRDASQSNAPSRQQLREIVGFSRRLLSNKDAELHFSKAANGGEQIALEGMPRLFANLKEGKRGEECIRGLSDFSDLRLEFESVLQRMQNGNGEAKLKRLFRLGSEYLPNMMPTRAVAQQHLSMYYDTELGEHVAFEHSGIGTLAAWSAGRRQIWICMKDNLFAFEDAPLLALGIDCREFASILMGREFTLEGRVIAGKTEHGYIVKYMTNGSAEQTRLISP